MAEAAVLKDEPATVTVETAEVPVETVEVPVETVEVPVETVEVPVEKPADKPVEVVEAPVEKPAETTAAPVFIIPERVMMVSKLQQQKHYLQLGAFKEKNSAIKAAGKLDAAYPVTILTDEATAGVSYKLLLGPLSADESGIMLFNFRAGGYSDAFIRRIE